MVSRVGNAAQFPFAGKVLMQCLELVDKLLADRGEDFSGRNRAIGLYSDEELRNVGVSDYLTKVSKERR